MEIGTAILVVGVIYLMVVSRGFRIAAAITAAFAIALLWFIMQPDDWKYRFWHPQAAVPASSA